MNVHHSSNRDSGKPIGHIRPIRRAFSNQSKKDHPEQTGPNRSKPDQTKKVPAKLVLKTPDFSHHLQRLAPIRTNW
jgi:hypothetical protein